MIEFLSAEFVFLLLLLPIIYLIKQKKNKKEDSSAFIIPIISSNIKKKQTRNYLVTFVNNIYYVYFIIIVLVLMRPIIHKKEQLVEHRGANIMLCIDISNSMATTDLKPSRLEIAKTSAIDFINKQTYSKIGLVVFASEAVTLSPPTHDHQTIINKIKKIKIGTLGDGTAIGLGLATSMLRLKNLSGNTNIIILITDGDENCSEVSPIDAALVAEKLKIKIYTIGIGSSYDKFAFNNSDNSTNQSKNTNTNTNININFNTNNNFTYNATLGENLLKNISQKTGALFFTFNQTNKIENIYSQISSIEKIEHVPVLYNTTTSLQEYILVLLLFLIIIEIYLRITILKLL